MTTAPDLRSRAEALGQTLPPLLAEAEMLAATVMLGEHGRRRAGLGDEFWQYRPAHQGDSARMIDWRRSARSDAHFVREREWQAAQSVTIWVDPSKSMAFTGDKSRAPKSDRARLLGLALAGAERLGRGGLAQQGVVVGVGGVEVAEGEHALGAGAAQERRQQVAGLVLPAGGERGVGREVRVEAGQTVEDPGEKDLHVAPDRGGRRAVAAAIIEDGGKPT